MSDSNEVVADPRLEKRTRRRFSVPERQRLLAEADSLAYGTKGAWLRRNGLYAGQLSTWRKEFADHGEAGVAARKSGRQPADSRDKEIERLKKDNARLKQRAYVAEQLVDLQKKIFLVLETHNSGPMS
jgi:transposase-like protein